jgi:CIC family chloride channel protein
MERAIAQNRPPETQVTAISTARSALVTLDEDESIGAALQKMGRAGVGRIPVISAADPDRLVGMITRYDVVNAYNTGLMRRAELQHRTRQLRVRNIDGAEFVRVTITPEDNTLNHTVSELAAGLPHDCVLVSVRRAGRLLIPHGDTRLQAGDEITAFVSHAQRDELLLRLHKLPEQLATREPATG